MTVSDNTTQAESLSNFVKKKGKKGVKKSKMMTKNVLSNPGGALDLTAKRATSRKFKQALSTIPELITFYNTAKGLYLGKIV